MKIEFKIEDFETIQYAVYNRNTQELVFRRGTCSCGVPQVWFDKYEQAERLLDEALHYFPDDHILTIIKKHSKVHVEDTMPPRP